jgi:hypothetical protein
MKLALFRNGSGNSLPAFKEVSKDGVFLSLEKQFQG